MLRRALLLSAVCTVSAAAPAVAQEEAPPPWWEDEVTWYEEEAADAAGGADPNAPAPTPAAPTGQASGPLPAGVPYRGLILTYARKRGLEAAFVAAIMRAESAFDPRARSRVGARGLMQLMPSTARGMGAEVSRLDHPETNIAYGTLYLTKVRAAVGGDLRLIAAGYNAGPGAVKKHRGIPPYAETRAYVRKVAQYRAQYRAAIGR